MIRTCEPGFGKRLRKERERLGLSPAEFAEKAGVKRATQYLYETEESQPNYRYFKAIIEMGINIQYLFFNTRFENSRLNFTPSLLRDIYKIVDEVAIDKKGKLLPFESRLDFFCTLCAAYSGREDDQIDFNTVRTMLNK